MSVLMAGFGRHRSLRNSEARASERHASVASSGFMTIGAAVAGLVLALSPGVSRAATAEGTLITNVACETYAAVDGYQFTASYCVTATVLVANPSVQCNKNATPSIECSGGTITFCIYAFNSSAFTSAFNVTLRDRMPDNMSYVTGQTLWPGNTAGATITQGWGSEPFPGPIFIWGSEPPAGVVSGSGYYYLRWVINMLGPRQSALICYKTRIL